MYVSYVRQLTDHMNSLRLLLCIQVMWVTTARSGTPEICIPCDVGISLCTNATADTRGNIAMVGDLGRVGVYTSKTQSIAWSCVPRQVLLLDCALRDDTLIVVGTEGEVWSRIGLDDWRAIPLPRAERCRTVAMRNGSVLVGTMEGTLWMRSLDGSGDWTLVYTSQLAIRDLVVTDSTCIAVGDRALFLTCSLLGTSWESVDLDGDTVNITAVAISSKDVVLGRENGLVSFVSLSDRSIRHSRLFQPSRFASSAWYYGSNDCTLSIDAVSSDTILVTGMYFDGSREIGGVWRSNDRGTTWHHVPLYDSWTSTHLPPVNFCPLVTAIDMNMMTVAASPGAPIVVYSKRSSDTAWSPHFIRNIFPVIEGKSDTTASAYQTNVTGIASTTETSAALVLLSTVPLRYIDDELYPGRSALVRYRFRGSLVDTQTVWRSESRFTTLQRSRDTLWMTGGNGQIGMSTDDGVSWSVHRLDSGLIGTDIPTLMIGSSELFARCRGRLYRCTRNTLDWKVVDLPASLGRHYIVNDVFVRGDGNCIVSAALVDSASKVYDVIMSITWNGAIPILDSICVPPIGSTNSPRFLQHPSLLQFHCSIYDPSTFRSVNVRCTFANGSVIVDTMKYYTKLDSIVPLVGVSPMVFRYDPGVTTAVSLAGGCLYSFDGGIEWRSPFAGYSVETQFGSGGLLCTTIIDNTLYIGGTNWSLYRMELPSIVSINDDEPTTMNVDRSEWLGHCTGIISGVDGTLIKEIREVSIDEIRSAVETLPDGAYIFHRSFTTHNSACLLLKSNGRIYSSVEPRMIRLK